MSYAMSRLMSTATASYAGYCFAKPEHLGQAVGADKHQQPGYDLLAQVFGVRDAAISTFGILGRSDATVRTAMWVRIACDVGDGIVLSAKVDQAARAKVLGATMTWGALNFAALHLDKRRARKIAAARAVASTAASAVQSVAHQVKHKA